MFLGASSIWIVVEGARRLAQPPEIHGWPLLIVAAVGLAVNLLSALLLSRGRSNANVRAAAAHVAADALGSVAAIVAGVLLLVFGWTRADSIASIAISILILWSAWKLIRGSIDVLMEGTPRAVSYEDVDQVIRTTDGVAEVHDLHVWSISDEFPVVTAHIVLDGKSHAVEVVSAIARRIRAELHIEHVTIQPEPPRTESVVPIERLSKRDPA